MKLNRLLPRHLYRGESGQVLPVVALMFVVLLGMAGIVLDVGRIYLYFRQLQASTDAAALAGAQGLPYTTAAAQATAYGGGSGAKNYNPNMPAVTMVSGYPLVKCLTTLKNQGIACSSPANANAITVKQQISVPMYFAKLFGTSTVPLTATATASMRGANPNPYNVAIILDTTLSMNTYDDDCGATRIACALNGVQALLQSLSPCASNQANCSVTNGVSANVVDQVSLFTFPNISVGTASINTTCTSPIPSPTASNGYYYDPTFGNYSMLPATAWGGVSSAVPYTFPTVGSKTYTPSGSSTGTYQVTNFLSDYRASDTASSLNSSSALVKTAGGQSSCGSMLPPNYDGNYGTYFAGAIYAAQSAVVAAQAANPKSQNVIILLSDGDATAPQKANGVTIMPSPATGNGTYPSWVNECGQAVTAAQYAAAQGTKVYSVAYGSSVAGCVTDTNPTTSPCATMQNIASSPQNFFSDYTQTGSDGTCVSSTQPTTSNLSQIFQQIAGDLTKSRLIPDNTP